LSENIVPHEDAVECHIKFSHRKIHPYDSASHQDSLTTC